MTPADLRALSTAVNNLDRLPDLIGDPLPSGEPVTVAHVGDALNYAADEIERLTAALRDVRSAVLHRKAVAPIVDAALKEIDGPSTALTIGGVA